MKIKKLENWTTNNILGLFWWSRLKRKENGTIKACQTRVTEEELITNKVPVHTK